MPIDVAPTRTRTGTQTLHAFNTRSRTASIFGERFFTNRWLWSSVVLCVALQGASVFVPQLRDVLHTVVPNGPDWIVIWACAAAPVLIVETQKLVHRARSPEGPAGRAGE